MSQGPRARPGPRARTPDSGSPCGRRAWLNLMDMRRSLVFLTLGLTLGCAARAPRPRVVLISVDGLWARDLERAESAGIRLPTFDSLRRAGDLAAGVIGSFPSVTYPS